MQTVFENQKQYENYYSPIARAARKTAIQADAEISVSEALICFNAGDVDGARDRLETGSFDHDSIDSWLDLWMQ